MADRRRTHALDKGGGWFVDATCIDCDVARLLAPGLIEEAPDGNSYFTRPPATPAEEIMAWRALLACPTGSIGAPAGARPPEDALPVEIAPGAWLLGFNSEGSFGANSWLVPRREGNVMVDGPRWNPRVVDAIAARGGLAHVLLTHRDDVADAERYARHFGARTWIHGSDATAAPDATDLLVGDADVAPGVRAIHVPGHTRGSVCYLFDERLLFTGDSLYWSRTARDLNAFRRATWHSWSEQSDSLQRLALQARFEWVLPGHGGWGTAPPDEMRQHLLALVERMRAGTTTDGW